MKRFRLGASRSLILACLVAAALQLAPGPVGLLRLSGGEQVGGDHQDAAKSATATLSTASRLGKGEPVRIVCFGDSVTGVYYHTGGRRAYTDMLGIALKRLYPEADLTMINAGISGHTTVNALTRIDRDVLAQRPTLVTVMFGLNDMTRVSLEDYRSNLETIISKCRAAGAEVLLATPNNVINSDGRPTDKLLQYCQAIREVGSKTNVPVCDCYAALDRLRQTDATGWRLLMSDAIHPNMDGHKRIAEQLARSITGRDVSLADVPPPSPYLPVTSGRIAEGQPLRILAMPPLDQWIAAALRREGREVPAEITVWPVAGKSLLEIEQDAQARVRALKPNLVLIAVPAQAKFDSQENLIHSFAWIMNWSLSFGAAEWDCVVVHPSVTATPSEINAESGDPRTWKLFRQLVRAQDLSLLDRAAGDDRPGEQLVQEWFTRAWQAK